MIFEGLGERPVLSINRDFSAPVITESNRSTEHLAFLSADDDNPFARYEALQQLMLDTLIAAVPTGKAAPAPVTESVPTTLADERLGPAFIAEAVLLPAEAFIGDHMLIVEPEAIHSARERLRA